MSIYVNLCLLLVLATVFNTGSTTPITSTDVEEHQKKQATVVLLDRFPFDMNNPTSNHMFDENEDQTFQEKRQLKKKWAKFYSGSQSPYTIAFPALIRTRRWIEQEDQ